METPGLKPLSYDAAREALAKLGHPWREPGEDDEQDCPF